MTSGNSQNACPPEIADFARPFDLGPAFAAPALFRLSLESRQPMSRVRTEPAPLSLRNPPVSTWIAFCDDGCARVRPLDETDWLLPAASRQYQ